MPKRIVIIAALLLSLVGTGESQDFFAECDANKDGRITLDEFPGKEANLQYFREIDTDRDDGITREELSRFLGVSEPSRADNLPSPKREPMEQEFHRLVRENEEIKKRNWQLSQEVERLKTSNLRLQEWAERLRLELEKTKSIPSLPDNLSHLKANPFDDVVEESVEKPSKNPFQDILSAEEYARVSAMKSLAEKIRGSWITACSQNTNEKNRLLVIGRLDPTNLVGVEQLRLDQDKDYDFGSGTVCVKVEISRANIIESIRRSNRGMPPDEYQEIFLMFPEKVSANGKGAWSEEGQKRLLALYGAQLDARRKLVEQLKGFLIKGGTRLENFVTERHKVVMSIESTLLIGVQVTKEEIVSESVAQASVSITRPMFIYSMRKGMESEGLSMTPEEYQNIRSLLKEESYEFTGNAALEE